MYEDRPASIGVVCVQIVSAATEQQATDVAAALEAGEAPESADGVETQTGCFPIEQLSGALGVEDRDLLLNGEPGDVSQPIAPDVQAGSPTWTVVQVQPWADAEAEITALFAGTTAGGTPPPAPGRLTVTGALATADVSVASEYGRWDQLSGNVVALTPAAEDGTAGPA
jgi:hypothetical protein